MDNNELWALNPKQISERCGWSYNTTRALLKSGRLAHVTLQRRHYVSVKALEEFLQSSSKGGEHNG